VYAAITRATRATSENMAEEAVMVGETMVTWLRDVEGFEAFLMLTDEETGAVQVIALWESKEIAEHHRAARARLRERISETAGVELGETVGFDVPYAFFTR
jgi:heme-degrading monooxygenase HmoA